jgi:DNA-binding transcriptional LysR family regulator
MTLDPRQLNAFLAVTRHGSLGRAAAELNVTQPALSRIIKRLEAQLAVRLFQRRASGMELTTYGEALVPHAKLLHSQEAQALEEINALRGSSRGTVRIGAVASAIAALLPGVIERLVARSPGLRVQIVEGVEDRLASALSGNEIDVAVAGVIPETPEILRLAAHEFRDTTTVVASTRHPLQRKSRLLPQDLAQQVWVLPPRDAEPRRQFNELMLGFGISAPTVVVETRSVTALKSVIANTCFLGWLPQPLYGPEERARLIAPLPVEGMTLHRRFFVYRRRHALVSPPTQRLLEQLRVRPGRLSAR